MADETNYVPDPREPFNHPSRQYDCCACAGVDAPSNLSALAAGALVIDVSWTDNATAETGFNVRWRNVTTGGSFVDEPDEAADATTATIDTTGGAVEGDTIEVQVRAAGASCSSDWVSAQVVVTDTN